MSAGIILVLTAAALIVNFIKPRRFAGEAILALSLISIYWLQPLTAIRNLDFWLPTSSIGLTVIVWVLTYPGEQDFARSMLPGMAVIMLVVLGIALTRYVDPLCCITASAPPQFSSVMVAVGFTTLLSAILFFFRIRHSELLWITFSLLIVLFLILKSENLAGQASVALRGLTGQSSNLASSSDIIWLGYSFLAFRLLHAIRDRQANRLPAYSLVDFTAYALFFPAVVSGPIDRCQHFAGELERVRNEPDANLQTNLKKNLIEGTPRILIGSFKKFVLADSLALFALSTKNASQTSSTLWLWVMLMAYSLRIYFDFSGYTDVALGVARLMGISLPENFDRPYLKLNLTSFWNSWHITLAQWFRSYLFFPFTRAMRLRSKTLHTWMIILSGQLLTMALIGLWHGITWNFLIWGTWHGLGLFIQNRWSDFVSPRLKLEKAKPGFRIVLQGSSWLATYLYVSLGWVWFALPDPWTSLSVFAKLVGAGGQ